MKTTAILFHTPNPMGPTCAALFWAQSYKTFYVCNLRMFVPSLIVFPFEGLSSLVFCLRVRLEPHQGWLLALSTIIRLGLKGLPGTNTLVQCYKTFYVLNLRMFIFSWIVRPLKMPSPLKIPRPIFAIRARVYPRQANGLTNKDYVTLKKLQPMKNIRKLHSTLGPLLLCLQFTNVQNKLKCLTLATLSIII